MYISASQEFFIENVGSFPEIKQQLTQLIESVPFAVLPGHSRHAERVGHIPSQNALFAARLAADGWLLKHRLSNGCIPDAYKEIDGTRVALEVQFANHARDNTDFDKFVSVARGVHGSGPLADLCIRIALDPQTAGLCSSGLATHAKFCRLMQDLKPGERAPVWSVAISHEGVPQEDFSVCNLALAAIKHVSEVPELTEHAVAAVARLGFTPLPSTSPQLSLFEC